MQRVPRMDPGHVVAHSGARIDPDAVCNEREEQYLARWRPLLFRYTARVAEDVEDEESRAVRFARPLCVRRDDCLDDAIQVALRDVPYLQPPAVCGCS